MKKMTAVFAIGLLISLNACGLKIDGTTSSKSDEGPGQTKVEMPAVRYPAAIIFEGGKGDPWFDKDNSKHTPAWRLYICLEKTTQPITGQVTLDLAKFGSAIEQTWRRSGTSETIFVERLNKVVLDYTYTTQLSDDPANNYGYAYGSAIVDMTSQQSWELVYLAPNEKHSHQSYEDMDLFNFKVVEGSLAKFDYTTFQVGGETYYVSSALDRFTYSEKDNRSHVVDACEKAGQPHVFQVGSEVTSMTQR